MDIALLKAIEHARRFKEKWEEETKWEDEESYGE